MQKARLAAMALNGKSTRQIATATGQSQTNVRYWMNRYGIKKKEIHLCRCGESNPENFRKRGRGFSRTECRACHGKASVERFRSYKAKAVAYKGGKCRRCGYSRCLGSLEFHHRDPSKKDPKWRQMRTWSFEKLKAELDKCDLLCANCHGEEHWK